ncbi:S1 family peptidase [Actinomadura kijaniata]|uniref:S1 family peptidase n=1 Tax=Actinomadura kijaniata TaxID=46161 RepID=UPI000835B250|nr:S1 family peptidase [Actinomadura kijaniata]
MLRSLLVLSSTLVALSAAPASAAAAVTYDVRGGDAFSATPYSGRCTIGFSVQGGYITSGQCARAGQSVIGYNGVAQGTVQGTTFPLNAVAWVKTNSSWRPRGLVNRHDGTFVAVRGAQAAPVGSAACMSGAVSRWRCGTILARNVTINFPEGILYGVIRTNICAGPGDLGAPLVANGQAQGTLVAASSGGCASYFLPVSEALAAYGLVLLTE